MKFIWMCESCKLEDDLKGNEAKMCESCTFRFKHEVKKQVLTRLKYVVDKVLGGAE